MESKKERARKDSKAVKEFFSVGDIIRHFNKNPTKLVVYVETGFLNGTSVMGVHIAQLAEKVGTPLLYAGKPLLLDGDTHEALPEWSWVDPNKFNNTGLILKAARRMFSSH